MWPLDFVLGQTSSLRTKNLGTLSDKKTYFLKEKYEKYIECLPYTVFKIQLFSFFLSMWGGFVIKKLCCKQRKSWTSEKEFNYS